MKRIANKKYLYDGLENQELYATIFTENGLQFKLPEILDNNIKDLKNQIPTEDFLTIVKESGFQSTENLISKDFYQSEEGLSLYYVIKENLLYIFSFGEKQPARYILNTESVWEL